MTVKTAVPAADAGLPEEVDDLTTDRGRVAAWCRWFSLPLPKLRYYRGALIMNDASLVWFKESAASIDWIACGDPRSMAGAFQHSQRMKTRSLDAIAHLDDEEVRIFVVALRAVVDLNADMDQVFTIAREQIDEYRASKAA